MKKNKRIAKQHHWGAIIASFIFFFPLGFFLLSERATRWEKLRQVVSVLLFIFAILFYLMSLTGFLLIKETGFDGSIIVLFGYTLGGGLLLQKASKNFREGKILVQEEYTETHINVQVKSYDKSVKASPTTNPTTKVIACKSCGANNTIVGEAGECEYCGSSIQ